MKRFLIISAIMALCSVCVMSQNSNLNQVELNKTITGVWQMQSTSDTVMAFGWVLFKNAILEPMYRVCNGEKELIAVVSFTYNKGLGSYQGIALYPDGHLENYNFKFSSEKEIVFERVEDFNTNKLIARNIGILDDANHMTINHYSDELVLYGTTKWTRSSK